MAQRPQPISRGLGAGAALIVALLLGTPIGVLWLKAGGTVVLGQAEWSALRFTVLQAALSAALSVAAAIPLARALARRQFRGRALLITVLGAPFILPVVVAIFGILAVFGRGGLVNTALAAASLPQIDIYGLPGILVTHVFFNLPLATRLLLQGWLAIPAEQFRLAATLGFNTRLTNRFLERPMLRTVAPGAFVVIFAICLTSFAVALALGGGPRATTIELAIYQAFRFELDFAMAAALSLLQIALSGVAALGFMWFAVPRAGAAGLDRRVARWDSATRAARLGDAFWVAAAAVFLITPMAMVLARGLPHLAGLPLPVWSAAARSVGVALLSVVAMLVFALPMAIAAASGGKTGRLIDTVGILPVAASPLVLGAGLYLIAFPLINPVALALPVTALVNALMALPFALRALVPPLREAEAAYGKLAQSVGLAGWARLRLFTLPRLRRPLGFSAGLAAALSMGDLGVITLFADPAQATLPLQMYRLMAAYRLDDAAAAALLLVALSLAAFWAFDRGGRANAAT